MRLSVRSVWWLSLAVSSVIFLGFPSSATAQPRSLYMPVLQVPGAAEATLALANSGSTSASVTLLAREYDGTILRGPRTNPVIINLPPLNSKTYRPKDLFGETISTGWIEVQTTSNSIAGSFLLLDPGLPALEGSALTSVLASALMFPKVTTDRAQANNLVLINTSNRRLSRVVVSLFDNSGQAVTQKTISLAPYAGWSGTVSDLIPELGPFDGYAVVQANSGGEPDALIGFETYRGNTDFAAIAALPYNARFETGYVTHFTSQAGYASTLVLVNHGSTPQTVAVTAGALEYNGRAGATPSQTAELTLDAYQRKEIHLEELLDFSGSDMITGFVRYQSQSDAGGLFGYMELKAADGRLTVVPVQGVAYSNSYFSYTADGSGNYTALALLNPGLQAESIRIDAFDTRGYALGTITVSLGPNGHWTRLLREAIPQTANQIGGSVRISTPGIVLAIQLLGTTISAGALAIVPAQANVLESQQIVPPLSARNGGTVTSSDGTASITIDSEALLQDTTIRVRALNVEDFPRPAGNGRLVGIVQGTPAGTRFNRPVRLRFPLADTLQPGTTLGVSIFNPATHQFESSEFLATVDSSGRGAWSDVTHFTVFAVSAVQSVQISSINPSSGSAGSIVTIYGSGFGLSPGDNSVLFTAVNGGIVATSVQTASADILTATVPSGAANGQVYVKVGSVTSNGVRFKVDTATNQAPAVSAGLDQSITLPASAVLAGTFADDGLPLNNNITAAWSVLSGPGSVSFGNPAGVNTSALFSAPGTYVLRLTVSDTELTASDDIVVNVGNANNVIANAPSNTAPITSAGASQSIVLPGMANLSGTATDDGLPSGVLTASWATLSGPGIVTFGNPAAFTTNASFSAAGTYLLRLTAGDGVLNTSADVVVTVNPAVPVNQVPVVNAGPGQTLTLPAFASLSGTATDDGLPNGTLTKSWIKISGPGTVVFGSATALTTTATFSVAGTYALRFTANDSALSASSDVVVVVNAAPPSNLAPIVSAGPDQTVAFPAAASLLGSASDDGLPTDSAVTVTWSKVSGPGTVIFVNANSLNASATFLTAGTYTLRLTATDSALAATDDVVVTVNAPANQAPTVNAGGDQSIALATAANLSATATDDGLPGGSSLALSWSKISGPGTVNLSNPSANTTLVSFSAAGTYTLRLTATDSALTTTDDVVVTVNAPTNQAPTVNAGADQTIALAANATLSGTAADDGLPTGSSLTRSWTKVSGPGSVNFTTPSASTTLASFSAAGTYTLRFTATDSALTTTDDVVVTVNAPTNQAPTVNAGADQSIALAATATLSGTASDDGLPTVNSLTVSWSKISGPGSVNLSNPSASTTLATFSAAGTYTLRFTATDSALTTTDDVVITVNAPANQAPTVNAGADQTVALAAAATLAGTATDDGLPAGSSLTRSWTKVSGPGSVNFSTPSANTTLATFSAAGTYALRFTASDSALTATDDVVITVNAPTNLAPTVNAGADQSIALAANATLSGTAADDGLPTVNSLTVGWSKISGPGSVNLSTPSASTTLATFSAAGTYTLRLTATDSTLTTTDDVVITVNAPANQAPTVNAGADQSIALAATATLSGTASDDGLPTVNSLTVGWSKISGPGSVNLSNPSANTTLASFSAAGTYTLRFTANDSALATTDDVVITVSAPANQAPTVNAGADQSIALAANATLSGTAADDGLPTGSSLTLSWSKISGPGSVNLSNPSANTTLAAFSAPGTYTMRFTATDSALTATDDVVITVNAPANQAPTVNAGADQSIEVTANAVLTGSAIDDGLPTGSSLALSWTKISGPGSVNLSNPSANTTLAAFSAPGTYTMRFTASDTAQSTSDDVVILVSAIVSAGIQNPAPVNQAPIVVASPSQTTTVSTSSSLSGTATDDGLPTGSSLAVIWTKLSGPGTVTFSNAAALRTMATFSAAGTYVLQLSASDGALTTRSSVNVVVTQNWGSSNSDAESIFMAAGSLALEGQSGWIYYNGGDAPEGGYMGWLNQNQTLTGNLHLPRQLSPGRYYVFFFGTSYDSNESVRASTGGGTSSSTLINDRDANGLWTDRAVVDVTTASDVLQVVLTRNPAIFADQKYLFRGVYITTNDKESVDRSSTVSTLAYPTVMDDSAPVKGNLITDGGFETGIDASWGFNGKRTELPIWDSAEHWEGQASIKIPLDHSANAYGDNIALISRVYHLKPNKKYTVSLWVKSSGGTVAVAAKLVGALTPPAGSLAQPVPGKFVYASNPWQRISFSGYALDYPTSDYQIHIEANELPGGFIWVDGVQLEEGDLTNYQSSSTVLAGPVITNQPGNIFYNDELVSANLVARNTSSGPATATFHYEIYDFMNALVRDGSQSLSLAGQTTAQTPFSLATGKLGIFRIVSWIDGLENTSRELIYSIIPRPAIAGLDPTSYLGIHPNYTDSEMSILQKMGMKWARVLSPSGFFRWSIIEPTEGQIAWFDADIQRGTNHGLTTMGTIGTNNYWPAWADNGGLPNLAKWQTFVGRLADHYKSSVLYWEIWNEPNSVFTPDFYAQMLKVAVDAIEINSPNAKIVGMGGVPLTYMQAVITALETRYPSWNWKQHIDVLSTHDYPDGEPAENFKTIISTHGLPVWNTETGSWDRGNYQGVNSSFTTLGKNLWSYTDAARFYTGMMGSPNSVVENFLRTIANGQTNYFYYDSRAAASPDYLRSHTTLLEYDGTVRAKGIAYAIAGSLVDHSIGLGNVSSDPGTYILVFDRTDGPVAALFSGDQKPRQLALGLSPLQYKVLDMMGNPLAVAGNIPFGRSPVYIKGIGISAATLKAALQSGGVTTRADVLAPNLSISDVPVGPTSTSSFRVRWIGLDDSFLPNLGEINPESNVSSDKPDPDAILYSYRLQGYDNSWSPWSARTYIDYSNLPNGSYTFSVTAKDAAGNQSPEFSRTIVVNVH